MSFLVFFHQTLNKWFGRVHGPAAMQATPFSFIQIKKSVRVFTDAFSPKKRRFFRTCQIAIKFSQQRNSIHVR